MQGCASNTHMIVKRKKSSKSSSSRQRPAHKTDPNLSHKVPRKVYIIDYQPLTRDTLAEMLKAQPDLSVCGISDGHENLPRAIGSLRPDLVIMEVVTKRGHCLDELHAIRAAHEQLPILIFSCGPCERYALEAMRAGANGYVCKGEETFVVLRTVRQILRGEPRLCREMTGSLVRRLSSGFADARPLPVSLLSGRELKVFKLIGADLNPRQIAKQTNLKLANIHDCRERLKTKLGLSSFCELQCAATRWLTNNSSKAA